jgi:hypothetical protein
MQTMMKGMNVKPNGNPDKDFVLMMTPHHQGAIDMAKVELQYETDPELRCGRGAAVPGQNVTTDRSPSTSSFPMRLPGCSGFGSPPPGSMTYCTSGCSTHQPATCA